MEEDDEEQQEEEQEEQEEQEEEEGREGEGAEEEDDTSDLQAALDEGLATPSGISSVASGLETPAVELPLRKDAGRDAEAPKALYSVIPQAPANVTGLVGSSRTYDFARAEKRLGEGVEVALDPNDLGGDLDQEKLQAILAEKKREETAGAPREDLSDMVAEHEAKQSKKRKKVDTTGGSSSKKTKEFKF